LVPLSPDGPRCACSRLRSGVAAGLPDPPARSDGRAYFDRKVTEGRTKKEAVYRQMLSDADRTTP
jgi:hypothetical protein